MYFPDTEAFSPKFRNAGHESIFIAPALGGLYYYLMIILLMFIVDFVLKPCARKWPKVGKVHSRTS